MTYAAGTTVAPDRSRAEIERTLARYGAKQFMFGHDENGGLVAFSMRGRQIRFVMEIPAMDSREVMFTETGKRRTPAAARDARDKLVRQRWRAMLLVIKGKLEAIETGLVSFDTEFLAQTVLPNGQTMGEYAVPAVAEAYQTNHMPELLPSFGPKAISS
jgi:hypothetical protein